MQLVKNTVFLTNLDRLGHRTVPSPSPHRTPTVTVPYPTVPHRTPPYPPFLSFLRLKSVKNGGDPKTLNINPGCKSELVHFSPGLKLILVPKQGGG